MVTVPLLLVGALFTALPEGVRSTYSCNAESPRWLSLRG